VATSCYHNFTLRADTLGPPHALTYYPLDPSARAAPAQHSTPPVCHTQILGVQTPGANFTKCAMMKSHAYDDSWYRNECHIINI
jgi:hypothetical protein